MKRNIKTILNGTVMCAVAMGFASSCDYLETRPTQDYYEEEILDDVSRAQSVLYYAYNGLSNTPNIGFDYYSDNAIRNNTTYDQMYSGWTSEYSPNSGTWNASISKINHINLYLEECFDLPYDMNSEEYSAQTKKRMRGEAFGLRAYYQWLLLNNFAGPSKSDPNKFLSFPILKRTFRDVDTRTIPRASYMDGFNRIMSDIDSAYTYIEFMRYDGSNTWNDNKNIGRISREMLLALKSRVYLFAASDAYKQVSWEEAAQVAYDAIMTINEGELKNLSKFNRRYNNTLDQDFLWRSSHANDGNLQGSHYPISQWGNGECNPTEDVVLAFPDTMGFPLEESLVYDANNPYKQRDPRFEQFIFYPGQNKFRSFYVHSYEGGDDLCGGIKTYGTRTGYFMKRLLSDVVDKTPRTKKPTKDYRFNVFFSKKMLYLDFAEAAIEAYGVAAKGGAMTFSAVDALEKVRERFGLTASTDLYLRPVAAKDFTKLKSLVRNERRLGNLFEGERLYDMMRWKLPASQMIKADGIKVTKVDENTFTYSEPVTIAEKHFEDRMYYFPIPRAETLRPGVIEQNAGWE